VWGGGEAKEKKGREGGYKGRKVFRVGKGKKDGGLGVVKRDHGGTKVGGGGEKLTEHRSTREREKKGKLLKRRGRDPEKRTGGNGATPPWEESTFKKKIAKREKWLRSKLRFRTSSKKAGDQQLLKKGRSIAKRGRKRKVIGGRGGKKGRLLKQRA